MSSILGFEFRNGLVLLALPSLNVLKLKLIEAFCSRTYLKILKHLCESKLLLRWMKWEHVGWYLVFESLDQSLNLLLLVQ